MKYHIEETPVYADDFPTGGYYGYSVVGENGNVIAMGLVSREIAQGWIDRNEDM